MHKGYTPRANRHRPQMRGPVSVTRSLRRDHRVIRQQLELLEGVLTVPERPGIIRVACHALARSLNEHVRREERYLAPHASRLCGVSGYHMVRDHTEFLGLLRDVDTLFFSGHRMPGSVLVEPLSRFARDLRRHIAVEEQEVFPAIDQSENEVEAVESMKRHGGR